MKGLAAGRWVLLLLMVLPANLPAANRDADLLEEIRRTGFQESELQNLLVHLADVPGPRLTGSPALQRARRWAMDRFRSWGIQDVRLEPWGDPVPSWEVERCTLEMLSPHYANLLVFPRAWSPGLTRLLQGAPLHVVLESPADFDRYRGRLRGSVALLGKVRQLDGEVTVKPQRFSQEELGGMLEPEQPSPTDPEERRRKREAYLQWRRQVAEFLREEGVRVVVEPGFGAGGTVLVAGGSPSRPPGFPQLVLAPEHYNLLVRLLEAGVTPELRLQYQVRKGPAVPDTNLIAEIPGSDPRLREQTVMLGAHLDSWLGGTGASDNAAGCAVVMEATRLIQRVGARPRRTIRAVLWSGEEQGLLGSRAWVSQRLAPRDGNFPAEHARISGYFNVDNGSGKIRGVYLQGNEAVRPLFEEIMAPLADLGVSTLSPRPTWGTDHVPFDSVGIPAFQFIQDPLAYDTLTHHTNLDVVDHTSLEDLQQASVVLAWFVWSTAMLDEPLPRKQPPTP